MERFWGWGAGGDGRLRRWEVGRLRHCKVGTLESWEVGRLRVIKGACGVKTKCMNWLKNEKTDIFLCHMVFHVYFYNVWRSMIMINDDGYAEILNEPWKKCYLWGRLEERILARVFLTFISTKKKCCAVVWNTRAPYFPHTQKKPSIPNKLLDQIGSRKMSHSCNASLFFLKTVNYPKCEMDTDAIAIKRHVEVRLCGFAAHR